MVCVDVLDAQVVRKCLPLRSYPEARAHEYASVASQCLLTRLELLGAFEALVALPPKRVVLASRDDLTVDDQVDNRFLVDEHLLDSPCNLLPSFRICRDDLV